MRAAFRQSRLTAIAKQVKATTRMPRGGARRCFGLPPAAAGGRLLGRAPAPPRSVRRRFTLTLDSRSRALARTRRAPSASRCQSPGVSRPETPLGSALPGRPRRDPGAAGPGPGREAAPPPPFAGRRRRGSPSRRSRPRGPCLRAARLLRIPTYSLMTCGRTRPSGPGGRVPRPPAAAAVAWVGGRRAQGGGGPRRISRRPAGTCTAGTGQAPAPSAPCTNPRRRLPNARRCRRPLRRPRPPPPPPPPLFVPGPLPRMACR